MKDIQYIKVPKLSESISEATVDSIFEGEMIEYGDIAFVLETEKAALEIQSEYTGKIKFLKNIGDTVKENDILAEIEVMEVKKSKTEISKPSKTEIVSEPKTDDLITKDKLIEIINEQSSSVEMSVSPSVEEMLNNYNLDPISIQGSGYSNRITEQDVENYISLSKEKLNSVNSITQGSDKVKGTTFNECNMQKLLEIKESYKEEFHKKYGAKLSIIPFFVKAVLLAMNEFPDVTASFNAQGNTLTKNQNNSVGVAISQGNSIIIKKIDDMNFAKISVMYSAHVNAIEGGDLKSLDNNFIITNGGYFGSTLSIPVLTKNASCVLGLHRITKRVVMDENDNIKNVPMMNIAMSYDHRVINGKTAILFLNSVKNKIESPNKILLEI